VYENLWDVQGAIAKSAPFQNDTVTVEKKLSFLFPNDTVPLPIKSFFKSTQQQIDIVEHELGGKCSLDHPQRPVC
jgi:hypothetical protein